MVGTCKWRFMSFEDAYGKSGVTDALQNWKASWCRISSMYFRQLMRKWELSDGITNVSSLWEMIYDSWYAVMGPAWSEQKMIGYQITLQAGQKQGPRSLIFLMCLLTVWAGTRIASSYPGELGDACNIHPLRTSSVSPYHLLGPVLYNNDEYLFWFVGSDFNYILLVPSSPLLLTTPASTLSTSDKLASFLYTSM